MAVRLTVKAVAEYRGFSQRHLMFESRVDIKTLQKIWRNPYLNVTLDTLDKLSKALNVDASLLIESDPPLPKTLE